MAFIKLACFHTGVFGLSGMERSVIHNQDNEFSFYGFDCSSYVFPETYPYSRSKIYGKVSVTVYKGFKQSIMGIDIYAHTKWKS